jgi:hypothetical protein
MSRTHPTPVSSSVQPASQPPSPTPPEIPDPLDTRYPYTYACDLIREFAGNTEQGAKLSRVDASRIRKGIAEAIGMDDVELAMKLADFFRLREARKAIGASTDDHAVRPPRPKP